jgi:catechol 2,3-dioxygenase-like lactoylglutathione lyase family enzyme
MIKYVHTNILAGNWRNLSQFYIDVFGCEPVYPERNLEGKWIDNMTNISEVHIEGIHLKLPGYEDGPTIEIFGYNKSVNKNKMPQINEIGFTHIAFRVDDVKEMAEKVLTHGGSFYGEIVEKEIKNVGILTAVYMRDPEGNIVEIQNWK